MINATHFLFAGLGGGSGSSSGGTASTYPKKYELEYDPDIGFVANLDDDVKSLALLEISINGTNCPITSALIDNGIIVGTVIYNGQASNIYLIPKDYDDSDVEDITVPVYATSSEGYSGINHELCELFDKVGEGLMSVAFFRPDGSFGVHWSYDYDSSTDMVNIYSQGWDILAVFTPLIDVLPPWVPYDPGKLVFIPNGFSPQPRALFLGPDALVVVTLGIQGTKPGGGSGSGGSSGGGSITTGLSYTRYTTDGQPIEIKRLVKGDVTPYEFYRRFLLEKVVLDDSTNGFDESCFEGCASLTDVNFKDRINYVANGAFRGCTSLKLDEISADSLGVEAFAGCNSLTKIKIKTPALIDSVFKNCAGLKAVWLSSEVAQIVISAKAMAPFYGCGNLKKLYLEGTRPDGYNTYWQYTSSSGYPTIYYNVSEAAFDAMEV